MLKLSFLSILLHLCVCVELYDNTFNFNEIFSPDTTSSIVFDFTLKNFNSEYVVFTLTPDDQNAKYKFVIADTPDYAVEYSENSMAWTAYTSKELTLLFTKDHFNKPPYYAFIAGPQGSVLKGTLNVHYCDEIPLQRDKDVHYNVWDSYHMDYTFKYPRTSDTVNDYLNIYALGGVDDQVKMQVTYHHNGQEVQVAQKDKAFYNGDVIELLEKDYTYSEDAYFKIVVHAHPGINVRVGVHKVNQIETIIPDKPAIYAYINTHHFTENTKCYAFNFPDEEFQTNNEYSLSIVTRTLNNYAFFSNKDYTHPSEAEAIKIHEVNVTEVGQISFTSQTLADHPYFCMRTFNQAPNLAYSIQVLNITNMNTSSVITEPLINGLTYMFTLKPNTIQMFTRAKFDDFVKETKVNIRTQIGKVNAYIVDDDHFPDSAFSLLNLTEQIDDSYRSTSLVDINGFFTYKLAPPSCDHSQCLNQIIPVVVCVPDSLTDCVFEVSFADSKDYLYIEPNIRYTQVQSAGQEDRFTFRVTNPTIKKVVIELSTYSGDSNMEVIKNVPIPGDIVSYYIGNKEVVEINREQKTGNVTDLCGVYQIFITSRTNNMYTVGYYLFEENTTPEMTIEAGLQVLEYVAPKSSKVFKLENLYSEYEIPYITTFTPVNCEVAITFMYNDRKHEIPLEFNHDKDFLQHFLTPGSEGFNSNYYEYKVTVLSMYEKQHAKNDQCLIYITGIPLTDEHRGLVINEAAPFKMKLSHDKPKVNILYPRASESGDVLAYVNIDSDLPIHLEFQVNNKESNSQSFVRSRQIYFDELYLDLCESYVTGQLCPLIATIYCDELDRNTEIEFEFSIKTENDVPIYLKKNKFKEEYTYVKQIQYFVTDVAHKESGEINVNYLRGSGRPYMKLVPKELSEDDPDWNNKVVLPKPNSTDLVGEYDPFTRKLTYSEGDTSRCFNGCDMFIGVLSDELYSMSYFSFANEFSIYIKSTTLGGETVDIPINEYVYGSMLNVHQKDYYSFILPKNSEKIEIELQCETCEIFINKGTRIPLEGWQYEFKSKGKDSLHEIILDRAETTNDERYTIMMKVVGMESFYTQLYNFRIRAPKVDKVNFIEVDSDQSALCKAPTENSYCDFLIANEEMDLINSLFLYAFGQDATDIAIFVRTVNSTEFDRMTQEQIQKLLPRDGSCNKTSINQFNPNYIDIAEIDKIDTYVLVSVFSSKPTLITLLSTLRTYLTKMTPNPSSIQLFEISQEKAVHEIQLTLPVKSNYIVHVVVVDGKGSVGFIGDEHSQHVLTGQHDSLTLNVPVGEEKTVYLRCDQEEVFRVFFSYHVTSDQNHFDEITFGQTGEVYYIGEDFPIDNYVKIEREDDIMINFDFYKTMANEDPYVGDDFIITGYVVQQDFIIQKRKEHSLLPKDCDLVCRGLYDSVTKKGSIHFSRDNMTLDEIEQDYLLVHIEKGKNNSHYYNPVHYEVSVLPSSGVEFALPFDYYQTMSLTAKKVNYHLLRKISADNKYLIFEFSANSPKIKTAFSYEEFPAVTLLSNIDYTNATGVVVEEKTASGKQLLKLNVENNKKVFIAVYSTEDVTPSENSYVLKSYAQDHFTLYQVDKMGVNITNYQNYTGNLPLDVKFNFKSIKSAETHQTVKCKYHFNVYRKSLMVDGDNFNTINTHQSDSYISRETHSNDDNMYFDIVLDVNDTYIFTMTAIVVDTEELIAFEPFEFVVNQGGKDDPVEPDEPDKPDDPKEPEKSKALTIVICVVVGSLFLFLFVFIIYKLKRKNELSNEDNLPSFGSKRALIPELEERLN